MKTVIFVGGQTVELDLSEGGGAQVRYRLGASGEWKSASVHWDAFGVTLDNAGFDLTRVTDGDGTQMRLRRRSSARTSGVVAVLRDGEREAQKGAGSRSRVTKVKAQMPGKVIRVMVTEGAAVAAGTPLLVMEAMKMENEIRAPIAGVVQSLRAREGVAVESGAELLLIHPSVDAAGKA